MADNNLRVVRHLDGLSEPVAEFLELKEGSSEWVDGDLARDFEVTQEIMEFTIGYGIADEDGEILAEFDTLADAELARKNARIQVSLVVDFEPEERPKAGAGIHKPATVTEFTSDERIPVEA